MAELYKHDLGKEGALDVKLENGKIVVSLSHNHASGKVSLSVEEDGAYFLDKLAAAIPGTFDDVVIAIAKEALKKA